MTTDKNKFCYPGATAPGFKSAAREYACREAIRLGEREARTAKQPQGPVRGEKEDVVFTSCFCCFQKNLYARRLGVSEKKIIKILQAS